jgi:hypothetical protein
LAAGDPLDTTMAVQLGANALIGPGVNDPEVYGFIAMGCVVTDGMFGFIFAMVESWQGAQKPSQEEVVRMIVQLVQQGFATICGEAVREAT